MTTFGDDPVTDGERPLEEEHQSGDDVAQRLLERQADDDAPQSQGRQGSADLLLPDMLVDERRADRDERHAGEIAEQLRDALPHRSLMAAAEEGVVGEREKTNEERHPKQRPHDPRGGLIGGNLPHLGDKQHRRQGGKHEIPHHAERGGKHPSTAGGGIEHLGDDQERQRKADGEDRRGEEWHIRHEKGAKQAAQAVRAGRAIHGVPRSWSVQVFTVPLPRTSMSTGPSKA